MTPLNRIASRKINHPEYSHQLHYVGCSSTPKAFIKRNSWGYGLYTLEGAGQGSYETLLRAKLRAIEFGLL